MSLTQIAADLRRQAIRTGQPAKTRLPRGLALSYKRIDGQCTLIAGRPDVHPSTEEAVIVARAFGVPVGTDPEWSEVTDPKISGQYVRIIRWQVITWRWIEREPANQPALLPAPATYP